MKKSLALFSLPSTHFSADFGYPFSATTRQPRRINEKALTSDRQKTYVPWFLGYYTKPRVKV